MVEGVRADNSTLAIAAHLPDDRKTQDNPTGDCQGLGACGHAALHCHVGPSMTTDPKVRVPMPPLGPAEILDWMIAQILPIQDFERAPWPSVLTHLKAQ
jgi:hypothetical protein